MEKYKLEMPNFGHIVELWPIPIDLEFYQVTENAFYQRGKKFYHSGTALKIWLLNANRTSRYLKK